MRNSRTSSPGRTRQVRFKKEKSVWIKNHGAEPQRLCSCGLCGQVSSRRLWPWPTRLRERIRSWFSTQREIAGQVGSISKFMIAMHVSGSPMPTILGWRPKAVRWRTQASYCKSFACVALTPPTELGFRLGGSGLRFSSPLRRRHARRNRGLREVDSQGLSLMGGSVTGTARPRSDRLNERATRALNFSRET